MIWIDYAIIGTVVLSTVVGFTRGLIREILSIVIWIYIFFSTYYCYHYFSVYFSFLKNETSRNIITVIFLFLTNIIIGIITNRLILSLLEKAGLLGSDRILGGIFGIIRGVTIISITLFICDTFTDFSKNHIWKTSWLIPKFNNIIKWILIIFKIY